MKNKEEITNFKHNIIIKRCIVDLQKFIDNEPVLHKSSGVLTNDIQEYISIELLKPYSEFINRIQLLLGKHHHIKKFEYSAIVPKLPVYKKNEMWILRHIIFYKILLEVSEKLETSSPFDTSMFRLGIFGSNTPTSDIDIGIRYIGINAINSSYSMTPIAQTCKWIEDLFKLRLENMTCLQFDIEPYASLLMDPKDQFYFDTRDFTESDANEIFPYIGAGILRNYLQSQEDVGYLKDVRRQTSKNLPELKRKFEYKIKTFNPGDFPYDVLGAIDHSLLFGKDAIRIVKDYMLSSYDNGRKKYYKIVEDAEKKYWNLFSKETLSDNISKTTIIDLLKITCLANLYRAESYVCEVTVMDIVRGIQAKQHEKVESNPRICSNQKSNRRIAPCIIGPFGYLFSSLENWGYLIRFKNTYCGIRHANKKKCRDKQKKYGERVTASMARYTKKNRISNRITLKNRGRRN